MKKKDVPQDSALFGEFNEVTYAIGDDGKYSCEKSKGWDPKTVANSQYWKMVEEQVVDAVDAVRSGTASPLLYYMILHQMDPGLLGGYAGIAGWRVKRHLKAKVFKKLKPKILKQYATALKLTVEELCELPENPESPECIVKWAHLRD